VHVKVGCTPDWEPVSVMTQSSLLRVCKTIDNWMNTDTVLVNERVSGRAYAVEMATLGL
jgi:hypothetical protein